LLLLGVIRLLDGPARRHRVLVALLDYVISHDAHFRQFEPEVRAGMVREFLPGVVHPAALNGGDVRRAEVSRDPLIAPRIVVHRHQFTPLDFSVRSLSWMASHTLA